MQASFYIRATWDAEASVWISETNIPGLVIEAESLAEFESLMMALAPEMLAANVEIHNAVVPVDFTVSDRRQFAVA